MLPSSSPHLDCLFPDEVGLAHDQLPAAGLVLIEVNAEETLHHLAFSRRHAGHIKACASQCDPKLPCPVH
jgi:hypothetical protein